MTNLLKTSYKEDKAINRNNSRYIREEEANSSGSGLSISVEELQRGSRVLHWILRF